ncbi:MAG: tripartite tricarboxylate transporter substrate binding protein [Betaproteobacteria bacterium]|nr:tripartite tricarboxylate transporter substrate binding protein [Betaproteobacteria bacterium]
MVAVMLAGASAFAGAQAYPTKPIRLIVPYPAGGGSDLLARPLAQSLTETFGQQVIVENRGGAGGNLGMELVAKSPPDGYTLVLGLTAQYAVNPSLYSNLPYDPVKDFAPVALLVRNPYVLSVHPSLPVRSAKELIALAKTRAGQLVYSSAGNGSGAHLCGEMMKTMAGISIVHVPYKGAAPAMTDLISGQVQYSFLAFRSSRPHIMSGRLRALAVSTANRSAALPDLPAVAETLPGYDLPVWYGVAAPAGTPREIVARLNAEILRTLATPDSRKRMAMDAAEPIGGTPEQFGDYIRSEIVKYAKIVKESGAKID